MRFNQLKIGVILSYITMIMQNIIAIVYTPIMLRLLGQSEYGLYQLVASVISYLGLFSFGFGSAYMRFYSRYKVKNDEQNISNLNSLFMIVFSIIALVTLLSGTFLTFNIDKIFSKSLSSGEINVAKTLMFLMVINMAISFVSSVFDSFVTANEQYFFQRIINLLQTVLNPFLAIPLLLMGYKSIGLVLVTTIFTIFKLILNYIYCIKKLNMKFKFNNLDFSLLHEVGTFSFFIFINMIVDQINWSVDKFILGIFGGTSAVAIYSVGGQINTMYMSLSTSISSVFIPRVNKIVAKGQGDKELTELFTMVGRIQFIILALILGGFIILGKYFINIWAGSMYYNAYYVALLLIIPVTIPLIQNLGIEIQRAKNMHSFRSIVYFFIAVFNVIISIPLSRYFAEIGAALGTTITMIIGNVIIINWYYNYKIKLDIKFFWKSIFQLLPPILITVFVCNIFSNIIVLDSLMKFLITGIIYILCYLVLIYNFGMNEYEKNIISKPLKRIRGIFYDNN